MPQAKGASTARGVCRRRRPTPFTLTLTRTRVHMPEDNNSCPTSPCASSAAAEPPPPAACTYLCIGIRLAEAQQQRGSA